ncbi:hypothetical protein ACR42D_04870 [Desulfovibrio caledoniensis]
MTSRDKAIKSLINFLCEHADIIGTGVVRLAAYILDRKVDKTKDWLLRKNEAQNMSDEDKEEIIDLIETNPDLVAEAVANNPKLYSKVQRIYKKRSTQKVQA